MSSAQPPETTLLDVDLSTTTACSATVVESSEETVRKILHAQKEQRRRYRNTVICLFTVAGCTSALLIVAFVWGLRGT